MDMRVRRASVPAALAAALLLLLAWHAVPARAASIDPELVAESVTEDGYYVDSRASYLKSDAELDRLRAALEKAGRAGVVVLPSGSASGPVISRLLATPNHKATYVLLTGTRLQAVSNAYSKATVSKLVARASRAGTPQSEVLSFLSLLNPKHRTAGGASQKGGTLPVPSPTGAPLPSTSPAPAGDVAAAKKSDSGGNGMLFSVIGGVIIIVAAGGGFFAWRRKQQGPSDPPGPAGPGNAAPGVE
jgi:hypothetical protein